MLGTVLGFKFLRIDRDANMRRTIWVLATWWLLDRLQLCHGDVNDTVTAALVNDTLNHGTRLCPLAPPVTINFTLSEWEMTLIYDASRLCLLIYPDFSGPMTSSKIEQLRHNYTRFDAWSDWNDQAVVAKTSTNGICHASFAGSSCWNPLDQWQNLNPMAKSLHNNSCWVRQGYFNAYNTSYKDAFRIALDDCMASCVDNGIPCNLVLSGYSQG